MHVCHLIAPLPRDPTYIEVVIENAVRRVEVYLVIGTAGVLHQIVMRIEIVGQHAKLHLPN